MAPDGLGILFDQIITSETAQNKNLSRTNLGETIIDGRLWLLIPSPATTQEAQLEELPFAGFMPQWLP